MSSNRSAFTLIELLIVITIIGILAAAIVLNFSGVRERQQLALLADKSAAMMQVAQSDVRSGKYDSDAAQYFCEGAYFKEGTEPQFVTMLYDTAAQSCDFSGMTLEAYGLATSPATLGTLTVGGAGVSDFYALYVPPEAALGFYDELGTPYSGEAMVEFNGTAAEAYSISLKLSSLTGLAALSLTEDE